MKKTKKPNFSFQPTNKALAGLVAAGFVDARNNTVKRGVCLSRIINDLIEQYVTEKSKHALIFYYKSRVAEENELQGQSQERVKKYVGAIEELKNQQ